MKKTELLEVINDLKGINEILDFYINNIDLLRKNSLEYKVSSLIEANASSLSLSKMRSDNIAYIKQYSPEFADYNFCNTSGAFLYKNLIFIKENWKYSFHESISSPNDNPFVNIQTSIMCCLGVKNIYQKLNLLSKVHNNILRIDTYMVVRPVDLDAVINIFDLSLIRDSHYICRFVNYNQVYTSLYNVFTDTNNKYPSRAIADAQNMLSPTFKSTMNAAINDCVLKSDTILESLKSLDSTYYTDEFYKTIPSKVADKSLKVLCLTSRYTTALQYFIRDMDQGFRGAGYQSIVVKEAENEGSGIRPDYLANKIIEYKPDLVFQIDYARYHTRPLPKNVPFVFWIQDFVMQNIAKNEHIGEFTKYDIVASLCSLKPFKHMLYKDVEFLPVPLNADMFNGDPDNREYDCDIAMVNHFSVPKLEFEVDGRDISPELIRLIDPIIKKNLHTLMFRDDYMKVVKSILPHIDSSNNAEHAAILLDHIMITVGNSLVRKNFAEWIAGLDLNFHLYGNDWDTVPSLKKFARGSVKNGKDSSRVYNRARINVNTHPWLTLHPRVFESIGSGGFMLIKHIGARDIAPVNDLLPEGDGYVFFKDRKDFENKVRYYLKNESERVEIMKRGYKKVHEQFTTPAVAQNLLNRIADRYK